MKEANIMRKSNVIRRVKDSVSKTLVSCPNILKLYNNGKGGVYITDQKTATYRLDRKKNCRS